MILIGKGFQNCVEGNDTSWKKRMTTKMRIVCENVRINKNNNLLKKLAQDMGINDGSVFLNEQKFSKREELEPVNKASELPCNGKNE